MLKAGVVLGALLVSASSVANEENTLLSVHAAFMSDQNKLDKSSIRKRRSGFEIENIDTGEITKIYQNKKAKSIYLEPGEYCFLSKTVFFPVKAPIVNPVCFSISDNQVNNLGTVVIATRMTNKGHRAAILDIKQNFSEVAADAKFVYYEPVNFYLKNQG
ncbi:hypothetical protein J8M21_25375 [Pseudoalteromonas luteoviolacea]|uniref:hypothetical protein n=1 Tax=Pseudoalteromonas luteoviolacea TaxID=43657 RepID=UPI001B3A6C1B|nr:hypothetical protein [Pseudoalteromonas luteoviolacea]MBQ4880533.1 hypothetical protein [Pseudoalteromonas luteoviolacea]MBQ4909576.1 hypothetical protein [Pseudoalteromonas luteoviolacea]